MIILNISISELLTLNNPNIIDIRPSLNYNNNHIPGAKNIPYNSLIINPSKYLNQDETYYYYCKSGSSSKGLCQLLQKQGYKAINIIGGYEAWLLNK